MVQLTKADLESKRGTLAAQAREQQELYGHMLEQIKIWMKTGFHPKDKIISLWDTTARASDEDVFSKLQAIWITYRFATGKSKGKKAIVLKALDDGDHNSPSGLVAEHSGFILHAGVATKALERDNLERICRYIARPAVAEEKLSLDDRGDVI